MGGKAAEDVAVAFCPSLKVLGAVADMGGKAAEAEAGAGVFCTGCLNGVGAAADMGGKTAVEEALGGAGVGEESLSTGFVAKVLDVPVDGAPKLNPPGAGVGASDFFSELLVTDGAPKLNVFDSESKAAADATNENDDFALEMDTAVEGTPKLNSDFLSELVVEFEGAPKENAGLLLDLNAVVEGAPKVNDPAPDVVVAVLGAAVVAFEAVADTPGRGVPHATQTSNESLFWTEQTSHFHVLEAFLKMLPSEGLSSWAASFFAAPASRSFSISSSLDSSPPKIHPTYQSTNFD